MADTVKRTVAVLFHTYPVLKALPDGSGGTVDRVVWESARRGETIDVTPEESERGDTLGAFLPTENIDAVPDGTALEDMTVVQLRQYAKQHDISLGGATSKADIVAAIEEAETAPEPDPEPDPADPEPDPADPEPDPADPEPDPADPEPDPA